MPFHVYHLFYQNSILSAGSMNPLLIFRTNIVLRRPIFIVVTETVREVRRMTNRFPTVFAKNQINRASQHDYCYYQVKTCPFNSCPKICQVPNTSWQHENSSSEFLGMSWHSGPAEELSRKPNEQPVCQKKRKSPKPSRYQVVNAKWSKSRWRE